MLAERTCRTARAMWMTALAICCAFCNTGEANPRRPNILMIVSEDNGPELGCYGDPYVATPVLDQLADEGVRFENAYVPQAGCSQSRAALLTGLYPHQNGQIGLATWKFRMYHDRFPNLVRSLKQAGYRTGLIGKLHVEPAAALPFDMHEVASSNFSRKRLKRYAEQAEVFFRAEQTPFFLSVNYPDAHRPFLRQVGGSPAKPLSAAEVKPLPYFGLDAPELRSQTADYYNCLQRLDELVGDLLAALDRSGKSEETLVIYLGDHGADLLRGKRTSYEGGVRVPLIIRWPGVARAGAVCDELVSTLDLMPTLLEAAQAKRVAGLPGVALGPLLRGETVAWRKYLFTEFHLHSAHNFYPQRTVRNQRYKLICNLLAGETNPGYQFTLKRFFSQLPATIAAAPAEVREAYERMRMPPRYEMYDLQADPYEFQNLAESEAHAPVFAELKQALARWRAETADPLLRKANLLRLQAEITACMQEGQPSKEQLQLNYPNYFFAAP